MRSGPFDDNDKGDFEQVIVMAQVVDPVERKGGMRLNAAMKNEVLTKAMAHGFDKRKAALLKEEFAIGKAFFLKNFGAAALKHAEALRDTPFIQLGRDSYGKEMKLVDGHDGRANHWNVGGQTVAIKTPPGSPSDVYHGYWKQPFVIKDEALIERCRAWQSDSEKFKADYTKISATLTGMLSRITTYPSLEKNWPAGYKFYQHLPTAYPFRHQVPAVMINELNAALGVF